LGTAIQSCKAEGCLHNALASTYDTLVSIFTPQVSLCLILISSYPVWLYRSSGCYDTLRKCIRLPSERTLQDYTHYVEAKVGFSSDVDKMLINAAKVKTCFNREKCVILLLDEMHIREQLIFDKHSAAITGYANISDIVSHLDEFESKVDNADESSQTSSERHKLAKTMMVFMVRGLFNSLQFPYAQFACADITGDMLYDPFWEAVRRIETCGLKVAFRICMYNDAHHIICRCLEPLWMVVVSIGD